MPRQKRYLHSAGTLDRFSASQAPRPGQPVTPVLVALGSTDQFLSTPTPFRLTSHQKRI
ncbi:hypothetical protein EI94DRAFT_1745374, partial [Lactarius quietus]